MTGCPYWLGKVAEPDGQIKKPSKNTEMYLIKFYATGDYAWIKADLIHKREKNKYCQGHKVSRFNDAIISIEKPVEQRKQGKSDASDKELESKESDNAPLSTKNKNIQSCLVDISGFKEQASTSRNTRFSSDTTADTCSTMKIVNRDLFPNNEKYERDMSAFQKHKEFVGEAMGEKDIREVAGIGEVLGERLTDAGYDKAYSLLGQFLIFMKNQDLFMSWIKMEAGANKKQGGAASSCLKEWCDAFL